jgi:hypothetical protein
MTTSRAVVADLAGRISRSLTREMPRSFELRAHISAQESHTDGYVATIGSVPGHAHAELYLDRFSGHPTPRFWFGFETRTMTDLRRLRDLAKAVGFGDPLVRTSRDVIGDRPGLRYRHRLQELEFDRLVEDRLRPKYYLGVYYPRPWPMPDGALDDVSTQAMEFFRRLTPAFNSIDREDAILRWGGPDLVSEALAVRFVSRWLRRRHYHVEDRQRVLCGFDLLATTESDELHVEVKGTSGSQHQFFLTRNEWKTAQRDPQWRVFLVVDVKRAPRLHRLDRDALKERFHFEPTEWFVSRKKLP